MLILIQADTMSKIWLFVGIYGLGSGVVGTLLPIVTRDIFGGASFRAILGFSAVFLFAGRAIGTPLAGFMFDAAGSYHTVFVVITVMYATATLGIYFAFGARPKPLMRLTVSKNCRA